MHDQISLILTYIRGVWRFRWFIFIIAWPVAISGWVFVSQMPDEYEASARIYVDTRSVLRPLLRGLAIQSEMGDEINMMTKTIFSRPNLEKIARMTDMDLYAKNDQDMDRIIQQLKAKLKLARGRGDNLFTISHADADPKLSKNTVQALLTIFVENTLGDKRKDTDSAQKFLDEQIQDYEQKLVEAEDRLTKFKQKYVGMMPSDSGSYYSRMQAATGELKNVELLKREAVQRRDELQRQLEDFEDSEDEGDNLLDFSKPGSSPTIYDARIQQLEAQRDELLLRYTNNHPNIVSINNTIENLQNRKLNEKPADIVVKDNSIETSPVFQQMKLALGEAEANVASLNVRVQEYNQRVKKLRGMVDTIPEIETELKRLNRDYSVNKRNYDTLLTRRESAKLGEEAEQSADTVKFRIIDPPFVGNEPVAPNRPLMMSVVFVGALVAGIVFPLFLSLIKPAVDTVRTLQQLTALPVLGGVTLIRTKSQIMRRRIEFISFLFMGSLFVVVYAGVMVLTIMGDNGILQIIQKSNLL